MTLAEDQRLKEHCSRWKASRCNRQHIDRSQTMTFSEYFYFIFLFYCSSPKTNSRLWFDHDAEPLLVYLRSINRSYNQCDFWSASITRKEMDSLRKYKKIVFFFVYVKIYEMTKNKRMNNVKSWQIFRMLITLLTWSNCIQDYSIFILTSSGISLRRSFQQFEVSERNSVNLCTRECKSRRSFSQSSIH